MFVYFDVLFQHNTTKFIRILSYWHLSYQCFKDIQYMTCKVKGLWKLMDQSYENNVLTRGTYPVIISLLLMRFYIMGTTPEIYRVETKMAYIMLVLRG